MPIDNPEQLLRKKKQPRKANKPPEQPQNTENLLDMSANATASGSGSSGGPPPRSTTTAKAPDMPSPMSSSAPTWDGRSESLRDFLWRLERTLEVSKITDDGEKLKWAVSYVEPTTRDEWITFSEYTTTDWKGFLERLRTEYPELVAEEQGSVARLRALNREYRHISIDDEERLLAFKRKFTVMATKCLTKPALVTNRELVELFTRSLDKSFQDSLNNRLSISGKTRTGGVVRGEDPYDWDEVIAKAVDLVSGKTIARALHYDNNPRAPTREATPQVKREYPDFEKLFEEMASIKDTVNVHVKNSQSNMDAFQARIAKEMKTLNGPPAVITQRQTGTPGSGPPRGCYYCDDPSHRWVQCPHKEQDLKDGKIKIFGNNIRFWNGDYIPREDGVSTKDMVAAKLPPMVVNWYGSRNDYIPEYDDMPNLGGPSTPTYGRVPEMSIYTNQYKDTRDTIIDEVRNQNNGAGELAGRIKNLETLVTKALSRKESEASAEEPSEEQILQSHLSQAIALMQKREGKKSNPGF